MGHTMTVAHTLDGRVATWLEKRGISGETAINLGFYTEKNAPHLLRMPYLVGGVEVDRKTRNLKARDDNDELKWWREKDAKPTFWNLDVLDHPDIKDNWVVITEGELDGASVVEAGHPFVMSLPFGALQVAEDESQPVDPDDDNDKMSFMWEVWEKMKLPKGFILMLDNDNPGRFTQQALVRRLRAERCKLVSWPDDGREGRKPSKDANDVLRRYEAEGLRRLIDTAKPYPVRGLYRMSDFPEEPEAEGMPMFHPEVTDLWKVVLPSFSVMTGYPGMGKSTILYAIIAHLIKPREMGGLGLVITVGSFETRIKPTFNSGVRAALLGCSRAESYSHEDRKWADELINERCLIIRDADREGMDVDRVLENAEIACVRDGSRMLILDPWNEMDHKKLNGETDTDYANRVIRLMKNFGNDLQCGQLLVAHPKKPADNRRDRNGRLARPDLYDVAGSAAYFNKADYGLVCHRPDPLSNLMELWCLKVREGFPGKYGCARLDFNKTTSSYTTYVEPPRPQQGQIRDITEGGSGGANDLIFPGDDAPPLVDDTGY